MNGLQEIEPHKTTMEKLEEQTQNSTEEENKLPSAIVVEDHPVIWDYAKACLEGLCEVKAYCTNTTEAEEAFRTHKPDLIWLDCYLGELSEVSQGIKNSGILLASWIKKHNPRTKIFLFTSSNETNILAQAQELEIEGVALGGKFLKEKEIVREGIRDVLIGKDWISPNLRGDLELYELGKITVFEFCVACSLILGKSSSKIADELDASRKKVNNATYRIKEKLKIDDDINKEEFLEILSDRLKNSFKPSDHYAVSDVVNINSTVQEFLEPVLRRIKEKADLDRITLNETQSL